MHKQIHMTLMTISERVFRSTSVLGSQGRALWCCCSQCPAGTALTASLSCWTWPCPGWLLLPHLHQEWGSLCWQDTEMKVSVAGQHSGTKLWGIPTCIESRHTHRDPWKAEVPHIQSSLHLTDGWGAQHLPLSLPTEHHLNHQEWTATQENSCTMANAIQCR